MKTMTCAQLGGTCEAALSADNEEGMMQAAMAHLEEAHPEMAAEVKAAPSDDPKMVAWKEKFQGDWANTPDNA